MSGGNLTLLRIDPQEITFPSTTYQTCNSVLKLTNTSASYVAFKVKTTAPKQYMVRPSTGVVSPGETAEVQIILHPLSVEPVNNSDRFLVQATATSNPQGLGRQEWIDLDKNLLQEQRLKVVFTQGASPVTAVANPPVVTRPDVSGTAQTASAGDLRTKYDELIQYTLGLEKEKNKTETELEKLKVRRKKFLSTQIILLFNF
jgi:hypothetical protein